MTTIKVFQGVSDQKGNDNFSLIKEFDSFELAKQFFDSVKENKKGHNIPNGCHLVTELIIDNSESDFYDYRERWEE